LQASRGFELPAWDEEGKRRHSYAHRLSPVEVGKAGRLPPNVPVGVEEDRQSLADSDLCQ